MIVDDKLENTFGRKNPFRVPDDYFTLFENRIMDSLPDMALSHTNSTKKLHIWKRMRIYVATAACVGGILAGYIIYKDSRASTTLPSNNADIVANTNDYNIEKAVDYVMMNNDDFYSYLTSE